MRDHRLAALYEEVDCEVKKLLRCLSRSDWEERWRMMKDETSRQTPYGGSERVVVVLVQGSRIGRQILQSSTAFYTSIAQEWLAS
jgi:hypothetical protein